MLCEDTGKTGVYLSNQVFIPLGMIMEYNKPMNVLKFETTRKLSFWEGKYSFRHLAEEYDRYFTLQGEFITNITPKKSYNHVDRSALPLTPDTPDKKQINPLFLDYKGDEFFIGEDEWNKGDPPLKLLSTTPYTVDQARDKILPQDWAQKHIGEWISMREETTRASESESESESDSDSDFDLLVAPANPLEMTGAPLHRVE